MIRIPLGTLHEVLPSIGVRISFVRAVYSEGKSDYKTNGKEIEAIVTA